MAFILPTRCQWAADGLSPARRSPLTLLLSLCPPAVTNFNNGLEASSDSDDEDKLHIVEEDSLQEPEAAAAAAAAAAIADGTTLQDSCTATAVLSHNGFNGGKRPIWTLEGGSKLQTVTSAAARFKFCPGHLLPSSLFRILQT